MRKGILLAGGNNSRLYPATFAVAKSLLPIYDKPLIYYPLASLLHAGIRDILLITAPQWQEAHRQLLGNGAQFGISLHYAVQHEPRGIADAFLIGRDFLAGSSCMLMLCDNLFVGGDFSTLLAAATAEQDGALVFAKAVDDPHRFGVVEFAEDSSDTVRSLEEKPAQPKSPYAVTGCYFYDETVCDYAAALKPSARGELEITDINRCYLADGKLRARKIPDTTAWFDAGTPDSMAEAADYVRRAQQADAPLIACLEEIGWRNGWIDSSILRQQATAQQNTAYGAYLNELLTSA